MQLAVSAQLGLHCIVPGWGPASDCTSRVVEFIQHELISCRTVYIYAHAVAGGAPVSLGSGLCSAQYGAGNVMCRAWVHWRLCTDLPTAAAGVPSCGGPQ